MKSNKILLYAALLATGLLLGWLLFGSPSKQEHRHDLSEVDTAHTMWTCSMHPQIMQPESGDCPICGMDLVAAERDSDGILADQFKLTENAMALANIQTSIVGEYMGGESTIKLSGKIAENEEAHSVQVSYFSGRIEQLYINFTGEEIRKGQLLATIYSPELYTAQQELITAASLKESQAALYKAVRNKLKLWKLSEHQINQIEKTAKVKENFPVYATVSGTVTEKLIAQGDYVAQGQPLLRVANLSTVWANFDVYEHQMKRFKKGQEVNISTRAYPNETFKGTVDFIDPVLNNKTRTLTVRVVLDNTKNTFKPGMFVTANSKEAISENKDVVSIPTSAVLWTGERSVVYLKPYPDRPVFEMREVVLGSQIGNTYQIVKGLVHGDEIVTHGAFTVDAAAQLQGKRSMMSKPEAKTTIHHEGHMRSENEEEIHFDAAIERSFYRVIDAYIDVKDALVQSDASLASSKSETLKKILETIPENQRASINKYWSVLHKASKEINENVVIAHQRKHFQVISDQLIEMVVNFKNVNTTLFLQFCPMADHNKGAYWLSKEEEVINPYFGDVMLNCGEVKQVVQ